MKWGHFLRVTGRLARGQFWLHSCILWCLLYVLSGVTFITSSSVATVIVLGLVLLLLVLQCIRRLHDRNYSGWWLLAVLIPVAGGLWLVWQLALRRGVAQDNRWGKDPLEPRGDYLVVG